MEQNNENIVLQAFKSVQEAIKDQTTKIDEINKTVHQLQLMMNDEMNILKSTNSNLKDRFEELKGEFNTIKDKLEKETEKNNKDYNSISLLNKEFLALKTEIDKQKANSFEWVKIVGGAVVGAIISIIVSYIMMKK